jgi:hypothetical protein
MLVSPLIFDAARSSPADDLPREIRLLRAESLQYRVDEVARRSEPTARNKTVRSSRRTIFGLVGLVCADE